MWDTTIFVLDKGEMVYQAELEIWLLPVRLQIIRKESLGKLKCLAKIDMKSTFTFIPFFVAAVAGSGTRPMPRIIFNCDGDSTTLSHFPPPITPKQLCRTIDELKDSQVDVFIYCMNRGDDTFSHRTKVAEIYGENLDSWELPDKWKEHPDASQWRSRYITSMKRMADNTFAILNVGLDPMDILSQRAHELGMEFWAGLRMNDIHEDDSRRFFPLLSRFKRKNPDLVIGSPYPDPNRGYAQDDFTWAFDFAKKQVRERKVAIIREACLNYNVDGVELDFQRGPWYFKPGEEQTGIPLMTQMMRDVRATVNEIEQNKGREITLAVRIPPTFKEGLSLGLDVRMWIKEELADLFTPMCSGYFDMNADVDAFVAATRGTRCRIAGGIELNTRDYGHATNAMLRAAASSYFAQGASAIYLFNYDCHRKNGRSNDYTSDELQAFKEIGDPALIARQSKHYFIARDMNRRLREEGGAKQLPTALPQIGVERRFTLHIGDDIAAADARLYIFQFKIRHPVFEALVSS